MMHTPEGLPTLSKGAHEPGDGGACLMEYVALLAGEAWSDSPACTHPVLAAMGRAVNDRLSDADRHRLVPLVGRLFGTAPTGTEHERRVLSVRLAVWCARQVLDQVPDADNAVCERAVDTAEAWADGTASKEDAARAADAAYVAAANAANAAYAAAYVAASAAANAANAAYAAYAAYAAASAAANADRLVALLTGLLDEHARLTGHTARTVTDADLAALAAAV